MPTCTNRHLMKHSFALLLIAASTCVFANETAPSNPARKSQEVKPEVVVKKATNRNVGRATAKPFVTVERPQNAFDVPLLRDAGTLPSLTAPRAGG
jgi:hypothetical protein